MAAVEFKPILESDLPEVAAFLHAQQEIESSIDPTQARPDSNDLRGFLNNPDLPPGAPLGETIRAATGEILGMILAVPRSTASAPGAFSVWQRATSTSMPRLGFRVFSCCGAS